MSIQNQATKPTTSTQQFTAQLIVRDVQASVDFYQKAFGFKGISDKGNILYDRNELRILECNTLPILLVSEKASQALEGYQAKSPISLNTFSPTIITVLCTNNIQRMYENAINAGAKPIQAPHKTSSGATTFLVTGLENYVWRFIDNFADLSRAL